jgi:tRNA threonylcarbamoyl adenosine modification protein (Sua5/YciO/YrdC/YwlC family)
VAAAVEALRRGDLVVYPTDTLYGLGCLAARPDAVKRLVDVKQLPSGRGVSVLFATTDAARAWTSWTQAAERIARTFLPGPLTLVLEASAAAPREVLAEDGSLGVRVVDRPESIALATTGPLTSTSANRHGEPAATTLDEARRQLGRDVAAYVDGGRLAGPPSTVVDVRGARPKVLRAGAVSEREILEAVAHGWTDG